MKDPAYEAGLAVRRRVLGDAHVTALTGKCDRLR